MGLCLWESANCESLSQKSKIFASSLWQGSLWGAATKPPLPKGGASATPRRGDSAAKATELFTYSLFLIPAICLAPLEKGAFLFVALVEKLQIRKSTKSWKNPGVILKNRKKTIQFGRKPIYPHYPFWGSKWVIEIPPGFLYNRLEKLCGAVFSPQEEYPEHRRRIHYEERETQVSGKGHTPPAAVSVPGAVHAAGHGHEGLCRRSRQGCG